jgi:hypothetical protein
LVTVAVQLTPPLELVLEDELLEELLELEELELLLEDELLEEELEELLELLEELLELLDEELELLLELFRPKKRIASAALTGRLWGTPARLMASTGACGPLLP